MTARRGILLAILSAALMIFVFPRFDAAMLAPVCLAPLLLAVAGEARASRRFLYGWIAGVLYWFGLCYWIRNVLDAYGGLAGAGAWGAFLLFCAAKAIHMAVFAALAGPLTARWYAIPAIAALWTGIERTHGPLGFAWLALGNAPIDMGVPLRIAPWTGVYGASFLFVMMNVAVAMALLRRPRRDLLWLAVLPLLFALPALPAPEQGTRSAAVVQSNLPMHAAWTNASMREMHDRLARLSLDAALAPGEPPPAIIAWPETPAPIYFETDTRFREQAQQVARLTRSHFLFGTVGYTREKAPLNSARMLAPSGESLGHYDKMRLVPFGEFIPPMFGFIQRITQEAGDFVPGREVVVFPAGDDRIGAFICYESAFPDHVRQFAALGATVMFNLTNDGYFGPTAAREQHLLLARMRAVENRRWLVRPANDGITASIDPAGRIVERWPEFEARSGRLRYSPVAATTFYTRHGDWFAWLCLAAGLAAAAARADPEVSAMTPLIDVRGLRYRYEDGTQALDGVDFQLHAGETVALLGANGSGKTTFVLHLNGLLSGEGAIRVCGLDVVEENFIAVRRKIGIVFQDPDEQLFMPTVIEDVAFGPLNMGLAPDEAAARAREALGQVGMEDAQARAPYHLSAGEKRRVAIAGVLAMSPEILVLDEPTTWLDPPGQRHLLEVLAALPQAKVIATHDTRFAAALATRAVFFEKGRIIDEGPVEEVAARRGWSVL